jgi:hypothetical protein
MKVLTGALLSSGLAVAGLSASGQPAQAADCRIGVAGLPTKLRIDGRTHSYKVKPSVTGCVTADRGASEVDALVVGPHGAQLDGIWLVGLDKSGTAYLQTASGYRAGTYRIADDGSNIVDGSFTKVPYTWQARTFVAKYQGYTSLTAHRGTKKVTLHGAVRRYGPAAYDYIAQNRTVYLQRYTGGAWHTFKKVTSPHGTYSYSFSTARTYTYRAQIKESADTWAATSGHHRA